MRLFQVHNQYRQAGGEDVVVGAEARLLREGGHDVMQYVVQNPSTPIESAARLAVAPWNPRASRRLTSAIPRETEIAHIHNTWFSLTPSVVARIHSLGYPVAVTLHNYRVTCSNGLLLREGNPCRLCITGSAFNGVRYACYRDSTIASAAAAATVGLHRLRNTWTKDVDIIVALSEFAREQFTSAGIPGEKIIVKPNFVWDPGGRTMPASDSDTALYVGRLSQEKGLQLLIEAWRIAEPNGLRLVVLGDGPLRTELDAKEHENIEFQGRVSAETVREEMKRARFLAYPSQSFEGAPLVLLESLAAGLPVLASQLGSMPELLGTGGVPVSPSHQVEAWAKGLRTMLDDTLVASLSHQARSRYEQQYNPVVALDHAMGLYRSVLESHARHSR